MLYRFPLASCFTYANIYISMLLSQFAPPSPPLSLSFLYVCISIPDLQTVSSVLFLEGIIFLREPVDFKDAPGSVNSDLTGWRFG